MCLGYSQIPGVDFSNNYAPVGNDMTFQVVMVLQLMFGFHAVLLDVETAFLYGKLEEEIYCWAIKKFIKMQESTLCLNYKWQCMDWYKQHDNGLNV